jgi:hypothetical protein
MNNPTPNESSADSKQVSKVVKSELYHIWKKARIMYDMMKDDSELEDWVKNKIRESYDALDEAMTYTEYQKIFPNKQAESSPDEGANNFLSNQDKRYPVPTAAETGDQFITRCILDANMKKRYPIQGDRFGACMTIYNEKKNETPQDLSGNPGEKFEDPMKPDDPEVQDPIKPILP